jgi:xanthine dehydrogenase molybdopterin-binding subunit B
VFTDPDSKLHPVTFPVVHLSATKQVTGEAQYVDDMPNPRNGLFAHFVTSPKGKAKFRKLDASAALKMPGVRAFFSAADIPGNNEIGPIFKGEELFARSEVMFVGHPVGVIVAESHNQVSRRRRRRRRKRFCGF